MADRQQGIIHERTEKQSPWQNGVAERCLTVFGAAGISSSHLWAECVNSTVHVLNLTAAVSGSSVVPYEEFFGDKPDVFFLRTHCGDVLHADRNRSKELLFNGLVNISATFFSEAI